MKKLLLSVLILGTVFCFGACKVQVGTKDISDEDTSSQTETDTESNESWFEIGEF